MTQGGFDERYAAAVPIRRDDWGQTLEAHPSDGGPIEIVRRLDPSRRGGPMASAALNAEVDYAARLDLAVAPRPERVVLADRESILVYRGLDGVRVDRFLIALEKLGLRPSELAALVLLEDATAIAAAVQSVPTPMSSGRGAWGHGDLGPSGLLIGSAGSARPLGYASAVARVKEAEPGALGRAAIAPELRVMRGATGQGDVYALGVSLLAAVLGPSTVAAAEARLESLFPELARCASPELNTLIRGALATTPAARWSGPRALHAQLGIRGSIDDLRPRMAELAAAAAAQAPDLEARFPALVVPLVGRQAVPDVGDDWADADDGPTRTAGIGSETADLLAAATAAAAAAPEVDDAPTIAVPGEDLLPRTSDLLSAITEAELAGPDGDADAPGPTGGSLLDAPTIAAPTVAPPPSASWSEPPSARSSTLHGLSLADVLQIYHSKRGSVTVVLSGPEVEGTTHVRHGEVVHAETRTSAGFEALVAMLAEQGGVIRTSPPRHVTETIHTGFVALMLEATQALDARGGPSIEEAETPTPRRSAPPNPALSGGSVAPVPMSFWDDAEWGSYELLEAISRPGVSPGPEPTGPGPQSAEAEASTPEPDAPVGSETPAPARFQELDASPEELLAAEDEPLPEWAELDEPLDDLSAEVGLSQIPSLPPTEFESAPPEPAPAAPAEPVRAHIVAIEPASGIETAAPEAAPSTAPDRAPDATPETEGADAEAPIADAGADGGAVPRRSDEADVLVAAMANAEPVEAEAEPVEAEAEPVEAGPDPVEAADAEPATTASAEPEPGPDPVEAAEAEPVEAQAEPVEARPNPVEAADAEPTTTAVAEPEPEPDPVEAANAEPTTTAVAEPEPDSGDATLLGLDGRALAASAEATPVEAEPASAPGSAAGEPGDPTADAEPRAGTERDADPELPAAEAEAAEGAAAEAASEGAPEPGDAETSEAASGDGPLDPIAGDLALVGAVGALAAAAASMPEGTEAAPGEPDPRADEPEPASVDAPVLDTAAGASAEALSEAEDLPPLASAPALAGEPDGHEDAPVPASPETTAAAEARADDDAIEEPGPAPDATGQDDATLLGFDARALHAEIDGAQTADDEEPSAGLEPPSLPELPELPSLSPSADDPTTDFRPAADVDDAALEPDVPGDEADDEAGDDDDGARSSDTVMTAIPAELLAAARGDAEQASPEADSDDSPSSIEDAIRAFAEAPIAPDLGEVETDLTEIADEDRPIPRTSLARVETRKAPAFEPLGMIVERQGPDISNRNTDDGDEVPPSDTVIGPLPSLDPPRLEPAPMAEAPPELEWDEGLPRGDDGRPFFAGSVELLDRPAGLGRAAPPRRNAGPVAPAPAPSGPIAPARIAPSGPVAPAPGLGRPSAGARPTGASSAPPPSEPVPLGPVSPRPSEPVPLGSIAPPPAPPLPPMPSFGHGSIGADAPMPGATFVGVVTGNPFAPPTRNASGPPRPRSSIAPLPDGAPLFGRPSEPASVPILTGVPSEPPPASRPSVPVFAGVPSEPPPSRPSIPARVVTGVPSEPPPAFGAKGSGPSAPTWAPPAPDVDPDFEIPVAPSPLGGSPDPFAPPPAGDGVDFAAVPSTPSFSPPPRPASVAPRAASVPPRAASVPPRPSSGPVPRPSAGPGSFDPFGAPPPRSSGVGGVAIAVGVVVLVLLGAGLWFAFGRTGDGMTTAARRPETATPALAPAIAPAPSPRVEPPAPPSRTSVIIPDSDPRADALRKIYLGEDPGAARIEAPEPPDRGASARDRAAERREAREAARAAELLVGRETPAGRRAAVDDEEPDGYDDDAVLTSADEAIPVEGDAPLEAADEIPSAPGQLVVNVIPWGRVFVDGKDRGFPPVFVDGIPPGPHELRIERDGFETVVRTIEVRAGRRQVIHIRLGGEAKP